VDNITALEQTESVRLDPERLGELYQQLGPAGAEDMLCRAVEELALRLTTCEQFWRQGDRTALRKSARSLVAISDQIGMIMLARVANDVAQSIDFRDDIATSATLCRLMRVGERSLTAVWDQQDLSV